MQFFSRWLQLISLWNMWKKTPWLCSDRNAALGPSNGHIHTQPQVVILPAANDGKFWFLYLLVNRLLKFIPKPENLLWAGLWNPSGYLATRSRKEVWEQEGSEAVRGSNSVSSAKQALYRSLYLYRYVC